MTTVKIGNIEDDQQDMMIHATSLSEKKKFNEKCIA
jgi:hypothetical protein